MKTMHRFSLISAVGIGLALVACFPIPARADELDDLIPKIAAWDYGQDAAMMTRAADLIIDTQANPERRRQVAIRLAAVLDDAKTTPAARQFICKQIYRIGTKEAVPAVARLLNNDETADMARYALERMPCPEAGDALRAAMEKAKGTTKVGIINSLGARRDAAVVAVLGKLAGDDNRAVAEAALSALGKIGGAQAASLLAEAKRAAGANSPELVPAADEALLACAADLAARKDRKAEAIYKSLYDLKESSATRAAALKALCALRPDGAVSLVVAALDRDDPIVRGAAGDAAREIKTPKATEQLARAMHGLKPPAQALMLSALADRGDKKALGAVTALANSPEESVRVASLDALGWLGDASTVMLLAKVAASGEGHGASVARASLDRLKGKDVDAAIAHAAAKGDPKLRIELIRSLGARASFSAMPTLWKTATDRDPAIRAESFRSLGMLAGAKDLPELLKLLVAESAEGPRDQAEVAVLAVAKRIRDAKERLAPILSVFPSTEKGIPARCALVRILGKFQGDGALEPIRTCAKSDDPKLRETAIRAMADWKTAAPLADLYDVARKGASEGMGLVALQAYLRLLTLPSDRPAPETLNLYEKGLALAKRPEEKKQAIAGLADVPDKRAVELLKRFQADKDLKADADAALKKLINRSRQATASHNSAEAKNALDGNPDTRWTTGAKMDKGMWLQVDLGWESEVIKLVLDATKSPGDYPRGYEVYVSNSTENWGEPVAKGEGKGPVTEITCKPKSGRYVRIVQTGTGDGSFWSIHELKIETK
jgi:HEAT repeat protein